MVRKRSCFLDDIAPRNRLIAGWLERPRTCPWAHHHRRDHSISTLLARDNRGIKTLPHLRDQFVILQ